MSSPDRSRAETPARDLLLDAIDAKRQVQESRTRYDLALVALVDAGMPLSSIAVTLSVTKSAVQDSVDRAYRRQGRTKPEVRRRPPPIVDAPVPTVELAPATVPDEAAVREACGWCGTRRTCPACRATDHDREPHP